MKTIELNIPKSAKERIERADRNQLLVAAAKIAEIAEPDDPHAQTELMQAIVDLADRKREQKPTDECAGCGSRYDKDCQVCGGLKYSPGGY